MSDQLGRLYDVLEDRRIDLDLQWIDVARTANISLSTLDRVRKGSGSRKSRRAVERGLRLRPGAIEDFLAERVDELPADVPVESEPATPVGKLLLQLYDLLIADNYTHEEADAVIEAEIARIQRKRRNEQRDLPARVTRTRAIG